MTKTNKLVAINKLREIIFNILGYDNFNLIRGNMLYDRLLFDYGYYGNGVTSKRIKSGLYYYNHICGLGNNKFYEGEKYKYRLKNEEINQIVKELKQHEIN